MVDAEGGSDTKISAMLLSSSKQSLQPLQGQDHPALVGSYKCHTFQPVCGRAGGARCSVGVLFMDFVVAGLHCRASSDVKLDRTMQTCGSCASGYIQLSRHFCRAEVVGLRLSSNCLFASASLRHGLAPATRPRRLLNLSCPDPVQAASQQHPHGLYERCRQPQHAQVQT